MVRLYVRSSWLILYESTLIHIISSVKIWIRVDIVRSDSIVLIVHYYLFPFRSDYTAYTAVFSALTPGWTSSCVWICRNTVIYLTLFKLIRTYLLFVFMCIILLTIHLIVNNLLFVCIIFGALMIIWVIVIMMIYLVQFICLISIMVVTARLIWSWIMMVQSIWV